METEAQIYDSLPEEQQIEMLEMDKMPIAEALVHMDPMLGDMLGGLMDPMDSDLFERKLDEVGTYCSEFGQQECPHEYDHQFADGIYYRQVTKDPFQLVLGARHRFDHQNILLSGRQILFTSDGMVPMEGPFSFIGMAESRKLTLTMSRVVFANVFANPENIRDVSELEKRLTWPQEAELKGKEDTL